MLKEITVNTKIQEEDMAHYFYHFVYRKLSGYVSFGFSIVCLIIFPFSFSMDDDFLTIMLLFGGLLYTVFTPVSLKLKAKRQILMNPAYKNPFDYTFREEGLLIVQDNNQIEYKWSDFTRIEATKKLYLFFVSPKVAFILPKKELKGSQEEDLIQLLREKTDKKQLKNIH